MRSVVIFVFGLSSAACSRDESPPNKGVFMPPCPPGGCVSPRESGGITVENRTGAPVVLHLQEADALRIDRRVANGTLSLPIPPQTAGRPMTITLEAGSNASFGAPITVIDRGPRLAAEAAQQGGILRAGDGPSFLALGKGTLFVRTDVDGTTTFFEPEDPKTMTLAATDRPLTECGAGTFSAPFGAPPELHLSTGGHHGPTRVRSMTIEPDGCRTIEIDDDRDELLGSFRICIPDDAYPFTGIQPIFVNGAGDPRSTSSIHFRNAAGDHLALHRVAFDGRSSSLVDGIELSADERPDCARVDATCGHVDVPVKVGAQTYDGVVHSVAYGQPIADVTRNRTFYVLAGSARPVAHRTCTETDDDLSAPSAKARVWIAAVTRGL